MPSYDALFQPLRIKNLTIRNRFLSTSHSPAYAENGYITDRYIRYEAEKARGRGGLVPVWRSDDGRSGRLDLLWPDQRAR